jgi:hypothetical protein
VSDRTTPYAVDRSILLELGATGDCELLVFFSASCPYCGEAAAVERSRGDLGVRPIWVAGTEEEARLFAGQPHRQSVITASAVAFDVFEIQAVPAAVLVTKSTVTRAWRYRGDESSQVADKRCIWAG